MSTARDIVEAAFRKLGIVASDEAMTADQADNGINALNRMEFFKDNAKKAKVIE